MKSALKSTAKGRPSPMLRSALLTSALGLFSLQGMASEDVSEEVAASLAEVQQRWAEIKYSLPQDQQGPAFSQLGDHAEQLVERHPEAAELHIWRGNYPVYGSRGGRWAWRASAGEGGETGA
ncbi:hypothetical protein [Vreelandella lionensis]|uniref:hypothetical protein n=1 Tax=Vreelandella lionensis TaxID=1144478 RepID=UPI001FB28A62|nr:hypothetical protein [Halomonas lionensis]